MARDGPCAKIIGWLRFICQFKFVATLVTQLDIDEALSKFSVRLRGDDSLAIFYADIRDGLFADLRGLRTDLGPHARRLLVQLQSGELHSAPDSGAPPTVPVDTNDQSLGGCVVEARDDGKYVIKMKLAATPQDGAEVCRRLLEYQTADVREVLNVLPQRLPEKETLLKLRDVFDFNRMELGLDSANAFENLKTHGDDAIDWLIEKKFPMLDPAVVKADAAAVRLWAKKEYKRFFDEDEAQPTWSAKRRAQHVPKPRMRIAGSDSIMEALFTTPMLVGRDISQYLHIADYMLAYDISSADVERVGSYMQLVKSKLRTSLEDSTFACGVFLAYNLPYLHEIDLDVLVEAWRKSGHKLPINKNEAESLVLRRLRARRSATFFLKKNSHLPSIDDEFKFRERAFDDMVADSDNESDGGD